VDKIVECTDSEGGKDYFVKGFVSGIDFLDGDPISNQPDVCGGDILNELVRRLHRYDEIARVIEAEKVILEKKLRELMNEKVREK